MASIFTNRARLAMRRTLGLRSITIGLGSTACGAIMLNSSPVRLDSRSTVDVPATSIRQNDSNSTTVSPQMVRQVASGSITGLGAGLVVAMFSRTLAILGGLFAAALHLASRFGLDVSRFIDVNQRIFGQSSLWSNATRSPWFTASFLTTFILAAFVHL